MFFFLASKFIAGNDSKNIFIMGSICYIIIHAYLFGNNAGETTQKYRHYLYYLFVIDAILTGSYVWLFGGSSKSIENDEDYDDNAVLTLPEHIREKIEENEENESKSRPQNIEDVHRKLLELKARQELKLKQDKAQDLDKSRNQPINEIASKLGIVKGSSSQTNDSPFAKKDGNVNPNINPNTKVQPQPSLQKIVFSNDKVHEEIDDNYDDDDDMDEEINDNNRSYQSKISNVSIPLYGSENHQSDTDIPLYRSA